MVGEKTIIMWWLYKHGQRETMNPETRQASDRTTDPLTSQATTRTQTDTLSASILHIVWWLHFSFVFLMLPSGYGKNIWAFSLRFKGIPLAGSNEFSSLLQILSNGLISHCLKLSFFSHPKPVSNKGVRTSTIGLFQSGSISAAEDSHVFGGHYVYSGKGTIRKEEGHSS